MNVTPLIDVVLVLLITFMVVAPQLEQDVPIELPSIFHPDAEVKDLDPLKVSIPLADTYYFGNRRLELDAVVDALAEEHGRDPLRRLAIRADRRLQYGDVRPLLDRVQQIGFPGLSLMVAELESVR